jgi:hypothetical protein
MQLLEWQQRFQQILLNGGSDPEILSALADPPTQRERRVAVYRNNVRHALLNVLEAAFPVVRQLIGAECYTATMLVFIARQPPQRPALYEYGEALPAFLATFPPLVELPWLSDVARLEWVRQMALFAAEDPPLTPECLAAIPANELPHLRLALQPSVQFLRSAWPIHSIWGAHQLGGESLATVDLGHAETVLIWRRQQHVHQRLLTAGEFALLTALAVGCPLAQAAEAALQEPGSDLSLILATLLNDAVLVPA